CPIRPHFKDQIMLYSNLRRGNKIYGTLTVTAPHSWTDFNEELELFEEVTNDLAFALHNMEVEKERRKTELLLGSGKRTQKNRTAFNGI
ncbi:MAG: hypothetical protein ACTSSI_15990, partial [Candidatus Helarchaeota archaeon]